MFNAKAVSRAASALGYYARRAEGGDIRVALKGAGHEAGAAYVDSWQEAAEAVRAHIAWRMTTNESATLSA